MLCWPIVGIFWCPVVNLVTFSSNFSNFERNPPPFKKKSKISDNPKILKSPKIFFKTIHKIKKNPKLNLKINK